MAYEHTFVAPEKSQNQIKRLIMSHGGANVSFGSSVEPQRMEGFRASVAIEDRPYAIKITVPIKGKRNAKAQDQEERRVWRVIYHHMKAIFEAADSGVIDIRELLLPFFVTRDGKTVGQHILSDFQKVIETPRQMFLP